MNLPTTVNSVIQPERDEAWNPYVLLYDGWHEFTPDYFYPWAEHTDNVERTIEFAGGFRVLYPTEVPS